MRAELLAEFHGGSVTGGEGDYYSGVFEAWELPVIGGVGYCVGEGGVSEECRQWDGSMKVRRRSSIVVSGTVTSEP